MTEGGLFFRRFRDPKAEVAYARTRDQPNVPGAVLGRLLAGEKPMRVWREFRRLTLGALAGQTGIRAGTLAEFETGVADGSLCAVRQIAFALDVAIDDLLPANGD